jgi:hypothetical protein
MRRPRGAPEQKVKIGGGDDDNGCGSKQLLYNVMRCRWIRNTHRSPADTNLDDALNSPASQVA